MNDKVSIITPSYNSEKFIAETIESVQKQTYKSWEMIIVDDCSNDNSVEIIQEYKKKDNRIKLVQLKENRGAAIARNKAIDKSNGKYISFLDSDDLWHPKKLEKQLKFMKKNNYSFTFTKYQHMTEKSELLNKFIEVPNKVNYHKALCINPIGCLTVIYNKDKLGKKYMPVIRKRQDYGLWLKILKEVDYGYGLNDNLAYYRLRENSISSNKLNLVKYQWKLYYEIENLSFLESVFYLFCTIINKIIGIK